MDDIFDTISLEPNFEKDIFDKISNVPNFQEKAKDVGKQITKKGSAASLGAYGDILDLIRAQVRQRLLPGQEAMSKAEFEASESLLPFLQDDDIIPHYSRLPSQKEAEEFIEMLGGPKEAQTPQGRIAGRGAEFVGGALPFGAGSNLLKWLAGTGILGQSLRELGLPEEVATGTEILGTLTPAAKSITSILKKQPVKKPSGLPERKFEKLKKPTKVFSSTTEKAIEGMESDFRSLTSDLLKKTNKSYEALLEDPEFKSKVSNLFEKVRSSSKEFTEPVKPVKLLQFLDKEIKEIGKKGLTLSDTEAVKRKELRKTLQKLTKQNVTAEQLLDQYRKNNESLSKIFPYGERAAENIGKREALESYNRAIADSIESHFGDSEFGQLFKFTNKRWSEIKKIETVDKFLNSLFGENKVNFKQAEKVLTDPKRAKVLENAIGKEAFNDFKQINKDLLSQENAFKLMRAKGFEAKDLSHTVAGYILKPTYAKAKLGKDLLSKVYRMGLSNPKMIREWKEGLSLFKKGRVKEGLAILNALGKETKET